MQSLPLDITGEIVAGLSNWEFVRYLMALSKSSRVELANYRHQLQFPDDDVVLNSLTQYIQHVTTYHLLVVPWTRNLKSASWCYRRAALLGDMPALLAFIDRITPNEYAIWAEKITPFNGIVWAAQIGSWEVVQQVMAKISDYERRYSQHRYGNAMYQGTLQALRAGHKELALSILTAMLEDSMGDLSRLSRIIAEFTIVGIDLSPIRPQLERWYELTGMINEGFTFDQLLHTANKLVQSLSGVQVNLNVNEEYIFQLMAFFIFPIYGRSDLWLRYMNPYNPDLRRFYQIALILALHYNQLDFILELMDHMPELREVILEPIERPLSSNITDYEYEIVTPSALIFIRDRGLASDQVLSHAIRMGDVELIRALNIDPSQLITRTWHPAPIAYYFGHKDLASYYVNLLDSPSEEEVKSSIGLYKYISGNEASDIHRILQS